MHNKRWITAIVLIPPVVLLILRGGSILFGILAVIVSTIALSEYYRIVFQEHADTRAVFIPPWGFFNGAGIITPGCLRSNCTCSLPLVLDFLGMAIFSLYRFKTNQDAPQVVVKHIFGLVYIPLLIAFGVMLYNSPSDGILVVALPDGHCGHGRHRCLLYRKSNSGVTNFVLL